MMAPSIWEVEAGGSFIQGSLSYTVRLSLKRKKKRKKERKKKV
jgi:hypothetical protein